MAALECRQPQRVVAGEAWALRPQLQLQQAAGAVDYQPAEVVVDYQPAEVVVEQLPLDLARRPGAAAVGWRLSDDTDARVSWLRYQGRQP